jgi:hypothetical protein
MRGSLVRRKPSRRTLRRDRRRRLQTAAQTIPTGCFEVLCRIDAYTDYVAVVEAESAVEAAELASDDHGAYQWEHRSVQEFDDRLYVTLDKGGCEIEGTEVR